jgi:hypothetical protein
LTTFALETFPQELCNLNERGKSLAASLKLFNDEHNSGLIEPKPGLFSKDKKPVNEVLDGRGFRKYEEIKKIYRHGQGQALMDYAKAMVGEPSIYEKVLNFKKSTLMAFAHGSCDSPLCDQLIFLAEYSLAKNPSVFKDIVYGRWEMR